MGSGWSQSATQNRNHRNLNYAKNCGYLELVETTPRGPIMVRKLFAMCWILVIAHSVGAAERPTRPTRDRRAPTRWERVCCRNQCYFFHITNDLALPVEQVVHGAN